jgi:hypothetical protein
MRGKWVGCGWVLGPDTRSRQLSVCLRPSIRGRWTPPPDPSQPTHTQFSSCGVRFAQAARDSVSPSQALTMGYCVWKPAGVSSTRRRRWWGRPCSPQFTA